MQTVIGPSGTNYEVQGIVGTTKKFRLRKTAAQSGGVLLLKVALSPEHNALLEREAYLLRSLADTAAELEIRYAAEHPGKLPLNNHFYFPKVVETLMVNDEGERKALILDFSAITEKIEDLVPIQFIVERENARIDPRTSAWILGKLLKMLVFTQDAKVELNGLSEGNIILHRVGHYVSLMNWSGATFSKNVVTGTPGAGEEIAAVTRAVQYALGADSNGKLPAHDDLVDAQYEDFLNHLATGNVVDAFEAHTTFYKLIRKLWPRGYHPFTVIPL